MLFVCQHTRWGTRFRASSDIIVALFHVQNHSRLLPTFSANWEGMRKLAIGSCPLQTTVCVACLLTQTVLVMNHET